MTVRQHYCEFCGVELRGRERRYCGPCRENLPARIREDFIREYGGKCQCPGCDVREPTFLSLDHIRNDGARHRRETGVRGWAMYLKIREEGYPKDRYRLLCHNCNMSRAHFGRCVHEIRLTMPEPEVVSAEQRQLSIRAVIDDPVIPDVCEVEFTVKLKPGAQVKGQDSLIMEQALLKFVHQHIVGWAKYCRDYGMKELA